MPEWTRQRISQLLEGCWPGEWGNEPASIADAAIVYRSTDLDDEGHLFEDAGVYRSLLPSKLHAKKLKAGDVLLEASGGSLDRPVGRPALFTGSREEASIAANFLRTLRPKNGVSSQYLNWALLHLHRQPDIWRYQQQTTGMINLKVTDYLRHELDVPPSDEQVAIAAVLATIDQAIEETEALIAKMQQVRAGMMHDLFIRGVTADGRLRPTRTEAPHLYRESPLGLIPQGWECMLLDDIAQRGSGHTPNKSEPSFWNGSIKWVSLADSSRLDRVYISETEKTITAAGIANSSAVLHPAGVVVLSRDAGVGKSAITTEAMAVSQHFMCWNCSDRLNNHYLYYWLQTEKQRFENIATGTTIPTIGLPFFRRYRISVPASVEEQEKIAMALLTVDQRLFLLEDEKESSRALKHGLMHDLLTGRVRVSGPAEPSG